MLRRTLFNIIRQEQRDVEDKLMMEERQAVPDSSLVLALRQQATNLRQELESFPEA